MIKITQKEHDVHTWIVPSRVLGVTQQGEQTFLAVEGVAPMMCDETPEEILVQLGYGATKH